MKVDLLTFDYSLILAGYTVMALNRSPYLSFFDWVALVPLFTFFIYQVAVHLFGLKSKFIINVKGIRGLLNVEVR